MTGTVTLAIMVVIKTLMNADDVVGAVWAQTAPTTSSAFINVFITTIIASVTVPVTLYLIYQLP